MANQSITKTFRFRIFPSKAQTTKLETTLDLCRDLFNASLQERRDAYQLNRVSLNYYDQANQLPEIKETNPEYKDVHSQISQDVLKRVDKAFQSFFRRVKSKKEKAGFLRFQNKQRYNSFTYAQSGFNLADKLTLSKIGKVKIKLHRNIVGKIKTLTISRDSCGKWFACFSVETTKELLEPTGKSIGIDLGLTTFATLSDGVKIENPKFLKTDEKILAKAQRRLSLQPKGSKERYAKRKIVAKIYSKIKNRRTNFAHQTSRFLVNNYDLIFFENLNIKKMMHDSNYAFGISDAAWNQTVQLTNYKAENAGRFVGTVNPRGTSQTCRICGHCAAENRQSQALFKCIKCLHTENADANASQNILCRGLATLGNQSVEATSKSVSDLEVE
jgi:putative transposase